MEPDDYVTFDPKIPKHKPIFTKAIIVIILIMFLVEIFANALYSDKSIILLGAKWNEGIKNGEYWRFITCTFLHGNILHLFLNVFALYIFGQELESIFGTFRFILLFLYSSWGATLTSYICSPYVAVGASGVLFGIIGGMMIFFYKQKEKLIGAKIKFKTMYTLAAINLIFGFLIPKIDNFAHIGGLVTGIVLSYFISPEYKIEKNEDLNKLIVTKQNNKLKLVTGTLLATLVLYSITKLSTSF